MDDRRDLELFVEAEAAGICRRPAGLYQFPADELAARAAGLRRQIMQDPSPQTVTFRQRFARLFPAPALQYITSAQRTIDTLELLPKLPHDLAAVCGVSRSGLAPAVELAMALHLPLYILSEKGVIEPGCGYRLMGHHKPARGPILVIDDSRGTGRSQQRAVPIARKYWPNRKLLFAVLYRNMLATTSPLPDLWVRELDDNHLFEWNLFNSPFFEGRIGYDFDGVLCRDGDHQAPLHLPRRAEIPLIVTGRHRSTRAATEAWLAMWRIRVRRMIMFPGGDLFAEQDGVMAVSRYKAGHYFEARDLTLFVESDERQASEIARLTGKSVLCPAAAKVF